MVFQNPVTIPNLRPSLNTSSISEFYDNIVYWEIAKNTNRFFVTFERGLYGIPNDKQESIGTAEIDYPHVTANTGSSEKFKLGVTRNSAPYDAFLEQEENHSAIAPTLGSLDYKGFITTTELKGTRYFQSTLTSSVFQPTTYTYKLSSSAGITTATRTVSASYFYPFSSHQLSVLRRRPTLIIDLDSDNELPNGIGTKGYVLIPEHTHPDIKNNLDFWLSKAGYQTK